MRDQLYRGHAITTALFSSSVVSAQGSESDDLGSSPGQGIVPLRRVEKKNGSSAFRLGLIFILIILTPQHGNEFSYLIPW